MKLFLTDVSMLCNTPFLSVIFRFFRITGFSCRALRRGSPRLAPHPMARFGRAAGKRPGAFPRTPFAAPVRNASAYIAFFTFERPAFTRRRMRYGGGFTRGLTARGHSVFCFSRREKKTSLAPCALAGDPLATTVCGQTPFAVVTNRLVYRRTRKSISSFISHHSSL